MDARKVRIVRERWGYMVEYEHQDRPDVWWPISHAVTRWGARRHVRKFLSGEYDKGPTVIEEIIVPPRAP